MTYESYRWRVKKSVRLRRSYDHLWGGYRYFETEDPHDSDYPAFLRHFKNIQEGLDSAIAIAFINQYSDGGRIYKGTFVDIMINEDLSWFRGRINPLGKPMKYWRDLVKRVKNELRDSLLKEENDVRLHDRVL